MWHKKNKLTIIDNGFVLEHNKVFGVAKFVWVFIFWGPSVFSVQHWLDLKKIVPIRKYELSLSHCIGLQNYRLCGWSIMHKPIRWTSLISTPTTSPCRMDDVWSSLFLLCKISHCYNLFDFLIQNFFFSFWKKLADPEKKMQ